MAHCWVNEWVNEQTNKSGPDTLQMLAIIINICRINNQMRVDSCCLSYHFGHRFLACSGPRKSILSSSFLVTWHISQPTLGTVWPCDQVLTKEPEQEWHIQPSHVGKTYGLSTPPLHQLGKAARVATVEAMGWKGWTYPVSLCPDGMTSFVFFKLKNGKCTA